MYDERAQEKVAVEVRAACRNLRLELPDACATGVALAVLILHREGFLWSRCDEENALLGEAVATLYAALEQPICKVAYLDIRGAAFGTRAAAAHLGRCLSVNSTIRRLDFLGVGGICDEAVWTAFSDALTSNATVESISLLYCGPGHASHVGATLADSHKLSALRKVHVHHAWAPSHPVLRGLEDMEGWGTAIRHNFSITELKLSDFLVPQGPGLFAPFLDGLVSNSTLRTLIIDAGQSFAGKDDANTLSTEARDDDADSLSLATMLRTNRSLIYLDIIGSGIVCNASVFDQGLSQNSTLKKLRVSVDVAGAEALMITLTTSGGPSHLKSLSLGAYQQTPSPCFPSALALGDMLASNRTLTELHLGNAPYSNQEWATIIFPALANNSSLVDLDLYRCKGVGVEGNLVHDALLEVLESNTCIKKIRLAGTPLSHKGITSDLDVMLKTNTKYRAALKEVPTVATTLCRLVLCGYPFAGKSTLLQTMIHRHSCGDVATVTITNRTRGIDIQELTIDGLTLWVWDFAGQREFHPVQDFIFPNATSVHAATAFVFTFNPIIVCPSGATTTQQVRLKEKRQSQLEFSYWLKFIRSHARQRGRMCKTLMQVVVTHTDELDTVLSSMDKMKFCMLVKEWVCDVALEFKNMIDLDESSIFFVDATNKDDLDFNRFEDYVIQMFHKRIREVQEVPVVCDDVARALGACGGQRLEPIISFHDFKELCKCAVKASTEKASKSQQEALNTLMSETKDKAARVIAAYLRDAGEVLYFSGLDFLGRNPRWFAHGILGYLIDISPQDNAPATHNHEGTSQSATQVDSMFMNSSVSKRFLADLLQQSIRIVGLNPAGTSTDQLIRLMKKLDLCYETDEKYLIPALLPDKDGKAERGECKRDWVLDLPSSTHKCIFVSRRLQCADRLRTFITPGFFPRLQVVLQRKANKWDIKKHTNHAEPKHVCELEKYFCRLRHNGMEILVEHSGSFDYFVDIMVKSYISREATESFLKSQIIDEIRRLCASSKGCQGVTLAEAIIRPDCVGEKIMSCRYRQSILVADLKERMATSSDYRCYWEEVKEGTMPLPAAMHDPQRLLDGAPQEAHACYPDWNVKRGEKRGLAVIISMEKYKSGERSGASEDRENLKALAQSLDFDFKDHVMVDYTATEVRRTLKTIAEEKVLEEHESFVCFVTGHGDSTHGDSEEHYFRDQDDEMLFLDSIVRPFRTCKHLQDKPKVFFVNSCRGSNKLLVDDTEQSGTSEQQQPTSLQLPKEARECKYVREVKDCLIVFSASGLSVSTRYPQVGTSFIRALKNAFTTNRRQMLDVLGVVCCASNEVAGEQHEWKKGGDVTIFGQCPVYVSSLSKLLYWR